MYIYQCLMQTLDIIKIIKKINHIHFLFWKEMVVNQFFSTRHLNILMTFLWKLELHNIKLKLYNKHKTIKCNGPLSLLTVSMTISFVAAAESSLMASA